VKTVVFRILKQFFAFFLIKNKVFMEKDYYEILSVSRDCSQDEIKKAFRKLALKHHPDRNQGNEVAEKKFKEAAAAYEILGDPKKRAQYDQFGHSGVNSRFNQTGFHNMQDIFSSFKDIFEGGSFFSNSSGFESFFGGDSFSGRHSGTVGAKRGADLRYRMEVSLLDVLKGVDKTIRYEVERECKDCKGSGAKPGTGEKECTECKGSGRLTRRQGFFAFSSTCPTCQGEGRIIESPCGLCFGMGRKKKKEHLEVSVPPGVDNGTHLRLTQKGESGYRGGQPGDLYVQILVEDHPHLKREGSNITGSVTISYIQALLGSKKEVHSLEGKKEITIPKGTQYGDLVTLKKEGLPVLNSKKRGDLLYKVHIKLPSKLKKKEEAHLKEIAKIKGESIIGQ